MNMKQVVKLTALGALVASAGTFAANGQMSTTSSAATAQVRGVIPSMVRITGLGDASDQLDLGTYDPAAPADMVAADTFCVYRNGGGAGTYAIEIEGDGGTTATTDFLIDNGAVDMAYTVAYNMDSTAALVAYPTPGTSLPSQTANSHPVCASGITAEIEVRVAQATADAAAAGTYTGDLTVTVTVE